MPDARDGMKPAIDVLSAEDDGLSATRGYASARRRRRGEGNFHPGGSLIYDKIVRMGRTATAYRVDGQGNFGSVDGDPPRRCDTEARLQGSPTT